MSEPGLKRTLVCVNCLHEIFLPEDTFDEERFCRCSHCEHEYRVEYNVGIVDDQLCDLTYLEPLQELDKIGQKDH